MAVPSSGKSHARNCLDLKENVERASQRETIEDSAEPISGTANGWVPCIAADTYGYVVAVWRRSFGEPNGIWGKMKYH
jgi:hypothetical protein